MAQPDETLSNNFDKSTEELQNKIMEEVRRKYTKPVIDNWQNPRNWGIMNEADGYGKITGPCGDTMEISIIVKNNKVSACTFDTDGCGTTIACGSIITEMATGKTTAEVRQINQERLLEFCGGLPEEDQHCALLAANTLQKAIDDYLEIKREPWRKFYRRIR